jgi:hypothetical protein
MMVAAGILPFWDVVDLMFGDSPWGCHDSAGICCRLPNGERVRASSALREVLVSHPTDMMSPMMGTGVSL